jgi:hypothetical protein
MIFAPTTNPGIFFSENSGDPAATESFSNCHDGEDAGSGTALPYAGLYFTIRQKLTEFFFGRVSDLLL